MTATAALLHRDIAASDATLCLATMEDLAGRTERPNYPGTTGENTTTGATVVGHNRSDPERRTGEHNRRRDVDARPG